MFAVVSLVRFWEPPLSILSGDVKLKFCPSYSPWLSISGRTSGKHTKKHYLAHFPSTKYNQCHHAQEIPGPTLNMRVAHYVTHCFIASMLIDMIFCLEFIAYKVL